MKSWSKVKQDTGSRLRKFAGYEILQPAEFLQVANFRNPTKFMHGPNSFYFMLHFSSGFWPATSKFGLDSSCLSRLNNLASLACINYKNSHKMRLVVKSGP